MDKILLEGLSMEAIVGVYEYEQNTPQPIRFDITLFVDTRPAAETDDVHNTVDYFAVSEAIKAYVAETHFALIETLADKVAELILTQYAVHGVQIKLSKPNAVSGAANTAVEVSRGVCD